MWNLTAAHHSSWSLDLGSLSAWHSISIPESLRLLSIRLISVRLSFVLMSLARSLQLALVRSQSHNLQGRTKYYFSPKDWLKNRKQSPILAFWISCYIMSFSFILYKAHSCFIPHSFLLTFYPLHQQLTKKETGSCDSSRKIARQEAKTMPSPISIHPLPSLFQVIPVQFFSHMLSSTQFWELICSRDILVSLEGVIEKRSA